MTSIYRPMVKKSNKSSANLVFVLLWLWSCSLMAPRANMDQWQKGATREQLGSLKGTAWKYEPKYTCCRRDPLGNSSEAIRKLYERAIREGCQDQMLPKCRHCLNGGGVWPLPGFLWRICPHALRALKGDHSSPRSDNFQTKNSFKVQQQSISVYRN